MYRFIHPQALDIRPLQDRAPLPWHLFRVEEGGEMDKFGLRRGLEALDYIAQREAYPGDHHRPALDTAQSINAFFERMRVNQVLELIDRWLMHLSLNGHRP